MEVLTGPGPEAVRLCLVSATLDGPVCARTGLRTATTVTRQRISRKRFRMGCMVRTSNILENLDTVVLAVTDEQAILRIDGQVGCGSCHSHYSTLPDHLVMTNEHSQLCHSCHAGY